MWVDLYSNNIFTDAQLLRRYDQHIKTYFPTVTERAMNRRAMGQIKGKYNPTANEVLQEVAYETHCKNVRDDFDQAIIDNALLIEVIGYEQAEIRLARYILSVGVDYVPEILEVIDSETGEVLQEYIPAIAEIEPLPLIIEVTVYNEEGEVTGTNMIENPLITQDILERSEAQAILEAANAEILNLVELRSV